MVQRKCFSFFHIPFFKNSDGLSQCPAQDHHFLALAKLGSGFWENLYFCFKLERSFEKEDLFVWLFLGSTHLYFYNSSKKQNYFTIVQISFLLSTYTLGLSLFYVHFSHFLKKNCTLPFLRFQVSDVPFAQTEVE